MNFLAHLLLAKPDVEHRLGNVLADFIRGKRIYDLSPGIRDGIFHHREIDRYTDQHEAFRKSVERISSKWGRYSPIIMDIWYDYELGKKWESYSDADLRDFLNGFYNDFSQYEDNLPEDIRYPIDKMITTDRFIAYTTIDGVGSAFRRVMKRMRKPIPLEEAIDDLLEVEVQIEQDFQQFFPELAAWSESYLNSLRD